jgi:hypothetical protein
MDVCIVMPTCNYTVHSPFSSDSKIIIPLLVKLSTLLHATRKLKVTCILALKCDCSVLYLRVTVNDLTKCQQSSLAHHFVMNKYYILCYEKL